MHNWSNNQRYTNGQWLYCISKSSQVSYTYKLARATLQGLKIDSQLKFNQHVSKICQKVNTKISAFLGSQITLMTNNHYF